MKPTRMDLHMHSYMSDDGEYAPAALMMMCKEAGLDLVALADHNTVEGVAEAKQFALTQGLQYIPAIELDCVVNGVNLHVLGYGINEQDPAFPALTMNLRKQEQKASGILLEKAKQLGLYLDDQRAYALSHHGCITGEIIAEVALEDERNHAFLKEYLPNGSRSDNPFVNFYWDYCSQGKPCYVEINYISLREAVHLIQNAGGIAILAHPGNNTKEDIALLDEIFTYDLKGLEVYSSYHSPEQIKFYEAYAKKHNLLMTSGSDFHGKTKPAISLGATGCPDTTPLVAPFLEQLSTIKE